MTKTDDLLYLLCDMFADTQVRNPEVIRQYKERLKKIDGSIKTKGNKGNNKEFTE